MLGHRPKLQRDRIRIGSARPPQTASTWPTTFNNSRWGIDQRLRLTNSAMSMLATAKALSAVVRPREPCWTANGRIRDRGWNHNRAPLYSHPCPTLCLNGIPESSPAIPVWEKPSARHQRGVSGQSVGHRLVTTRATGSYYRNRNKRTPLRVVPIGFRRKFGPPFAYCVFFSPGFLRGSPLFSRCVL